jgi:hypothetical protein
MPRAVWSRNITVCRATDFTPFRLLFRSEAVLPKEIKHQSLRTTAEAPPWPNEAKEKDLLESERLKVVINLQKNQMRQDPGGTQRSRIKILMWVT